MQDRKINWTRFLAVVGTVVAATLTQANDAGAKTLEQYGHYMLTPLIVAVATFFVRPDAFTVVNIQEANSLGIRKVLVEDPDVAKDASK